MIVLQRVADLTRMCRVENLTGVAFTGEQGGHKFVISAVCGSDRVALEGSVAGRFIRPDGTSVQLTTGYAGIDDDGNAVVTLPANCYTQSGPFGLVITHIDGDNNRTVIYSAAGYVRPGETSTIVDPENIINVDAIQDLIDDMIEATGDAEAAAAFIPDIIAPEYTQKTYSIGEYVTHESLLYRCKADIETAETWTAAHWDRYTVIDAITLVHILLNDNLLSKKGTINPTNWLDLDGLEDGVLKSDGTIKEPVSTATQHTDYVPVNTGDIIKLYRSNASPMTALTCNRICLYDANKNVVSGGLDSSYTSFTVPSGVAYVRLSFSASYIAQYVPMLVRNGDTVPTAYSAYFDPFTVYTEDFLTAATKQAIEDAAADVADIQTDLTGIHGDISDAENDISAINTELARTLVEPTNWLDATRLENGVLQSDGNIKQPVSTETVHTEYYIPVSEGDKIRLYRGNVSPMTALNTNRVCLYDANKNVVSGGADSAFSIFTIPSGVAYVRISFPVSYPGQYKPMLVRDGDNVPSAYSAYFDPYYAYGHDFMTESSHGMLTETRAFLDDFTPYHFEYLFSGPYTLSIRELGLRMLADAQGVYYLPFNALGLGVNRGNGLYGDTYVNDQIHPKTLGGYNIACGFWSFIRNIPLWHASMPADTTAEKFDGTQWNGKTWYAYGTSLTTEANGHYVQQVATWSGMTATNKGIGGGAMVSPNRNIYNALLDTEDGKLEADLITIEVGANDGGPIGYPWSYDTSTFFGALNYCLREMFQAGVQAQIVIMPSFQQRYKGDDPTTKYDVDKKYNV